ncbi:hypothetical protein PCE1_004062 [Barthelona sp. PCE]
MSFSSDAKNLLISEPPEVPNNVVSYTQDSQSYQPETKPFVRPFISTSRTQNYLTYTSDTVRSKDSELHKEIDERRKKAHMTSYIQKHRRWLKEYGAQMKQKRIDEEEAEKKRNRKKRSRRRRKPDWAKTEDEIKQAEESKEKQQIEALLEFTESLDLTILEDDNMKELLQTVKEKGEERLENMKAEQESMVTEMATEVAEVVMVEEDLKPRIMAHEVEDGVPVTYDTTEMTEEKKEELENGWDNNTRVDPSFNTRYRPSSKHKHTKVHSARSLDQIRAFVLSKKATINPTIVTTNANSVRTEKKLNVHTLPYLYQCESI